MNKKIDLTPIVGSQVLCEFWSDPLETDIFPKDKGFLSEIVNSQLRFESDSGKRYQFCRIYQHPDYWISNAKGDLVLPDGLEIVYMTRIGVDHCAMTEKNHALFMEGITPSCMPIQHNNNGFELEIVAAQIKGLSDGWEW